LNKDAELFTQPVEYPDFTVSAGPIRKGMFDSLYPVERDMSVEDAVTGPIAAELLVIRIKRIKTGGPTSLNLGFLYMVNNSSRTATRISHMSVHIPAQEGAVVEVSPFAEPFHPARHEWHC